MLKALEHIPRRQYETGIGRPFPLTACEDEAL